MTTYSPDLSTQLIAWAKRHAACLASDLGWKLKSDSIEWLRENAASMADQLEAAGSRIAELEQDVTARDHEALHLRNQVRYIEDQRDEHRATLNRFADRLHVVHEDPKITAAVSSALDERAALRAEAKRLQAVVEALDGLKCAATAADSISLSNDRAHDRAHLPDLTAQGLADRDESRAVRAAIRAFDAYRPTQSPNAREPPENQPAKHQTLRDCERALERQRPNQAQAQDGEIWICPCGRRFEHVCDEAEGCRWNEAS